MAVPVVESLVESPDKERLLYALLDPPSGTTFILESENKCLGLKGTQVEHRLSIIRAETRVVGSSERQVLE